MDKRSKILLSVVIVLLIVSLGFTFYRTFILNDFEIIETEEEGIEEGSELESEEASADLDLDSENTVVPAEVENNQEEETDL